MIKVQSCLFLSLKKASDDAESRFQNWNKSNMPQGHQNDWTNEQWEDYSDKLRKEYSGSPFYDQAWKERLKEFGYDSKSGPMYTEYVKNFVKDESLRKIMNSRWIELVINEISDKVSLDSENVQNIDFSQEDYSTETVSFDDVEEFLKPFIIKNNLSEESASALLYFITAESEELVYEKLQKKLSKEQFHVRVYGVSRAFGGAEEGGWWYDEYKLVDDELVQGLEQAREIRHQKEEQWKNSGRDSFYDDLSSGYGGTVDVFEEESSGADGMGDLNYKGDVEGMDFPIGWTTSEFSRFEVTVEISDEPLKIKERPRFE